MVQIPKDALVIERTIRQVEGGLYKRELERDPDSYALKLLEQRFKKNRDLCTEPWNRIENVYLLTEHKIVKYKGKMQQVEITKLLIELKGTNNGWTEMDGLDFLIPAQVGKTLINFLKGENA